MIWEKALCNFLLIILNHILQRFLHTPLRLTTATPSPLPFFLPPSHILSLEADSDK